MIGKFKSYIEKNNKKYDIDNLLSMDELLAIIDENIKLEKEPESLRVGSNYEIINKSLYYHISKNVHRDVKKLISQKLTAYATKDELENVSYNEMVNRYTSDNLDLSGYTELGGNHEELTEMVITNLIVELPKLSSSEIYDLLIRNNLNIFLKPSEKVKRLIKSSVSVKVYTKLIENHNEDAMIFLININDSEFIKFIKKVIKGKYSQLSICYCQVAAILKSTNDKLKQEIINYLINNNDQYVLIAYEEYELNPTKMIENSKAVMIECCQYFLEKNDFTNKQYLEYLEQKNHVHFNATYFKNMLEILTDPLYYQKVENLRTCTSLNILNYNQFIKAKNPRVLAEILQLVEEGDTLERKLNLEIQTYQEIINDDELNQFFQKLIDIYLSKKYYLNQDMVHDLLKIPWFIHLITESDSVYALNQFKALLSEGKEYIIKVLNQAENPIDLCYLQLLEIEIIIPQIESKIIPSSVPLAKLIETNDRIVTADNIEQMAAKYNFSFLKYASLVAPEKQYDFYQQELKKGEDVTYELQFIIKYNDLLSDKELMEYVKKQKKILIYQLLNKGMSNDLNNVYWLNTRDFKQRLQLLKRLKTIDKYFEKSLREVMKDDYCNFEVFVAYLYQTANILIDEELINLFQATIGLKSKHLYVRRLFLLKLLSKDKQIILLKQSLNTKNVNNLENTLKLIEGLGLNGEVFKAELFEIRGINRTITTYVDALITEKTTNLITFDDLIKNTKPLKLSSKETILKQIELPEDLIIEFWTTVYQHLEKITERTKTDVIMDTNGLKGNDIDEGEFTELFEFTEQFIKKNKISSKQIVTLAELPTRNKLYQTLKENTQHYFIYWNFIIPLIFKYGTICHPTKDDLIFKITRCAHNLSMRCRDIIITKEIDYSEYNQNTNLELITTIVKILEKNSCDMMEDYQLTIILDRLVDSYLRIEFSNGNLTIKEIVNIYNTSKLDIFIDDSRDATEADREYNQLFQTEIIKLLLIDINIIEYTSKKLTVRMAQLRKYRVIGSENLAILLKASKIDKGLKNSWLKETIKNVQIPESESNEVFNKNIKPLGLTKEELIDVAITNKELIPQISNYLKMPLLESAIYFLDITEIYHSGKEARQKIAKYSNISCEELEKGYVDRDWYQIIYRELGPKLFLELRQRIYNNRNAKIFDALTGKISKREALRKINDSRNKDMLVAYSLIKPGKDADKDLVQRMKNYRKFIKESKQFGAQRRTNEKELVQIAIKNLAGTFNFGDENLFMLYTFDLEMKQNQELFTGIQIEDYLIKLEHHQGKLKLSYERNGKKLKSKPQKIKKKIQVYDDVVKDLQAAYKQLKDSFEKMMVNQVFISQDGFKTYANNQVLKGFLQNLIYETEKEQFVLFKDNKFYDDDLNEVEFSGALKIAHPLNIIKAEKYFKWKEVILQQRITQPFKQLFRETYFKNSDEINDTKTYRYSSYLIKLKMAITLLQSVDWKVDYDSIFKLYSHAKTRVEMWIYNPYMYMEGEDENCFEEIRFIDTETNLPQKIENVDDIIFSEIMRDFDMAVSTAHIGEENKELGLSTVDIRKDILKVNQKLFKLDNITIDKHRVYIKGHLGNYLVNLKSGDAQKEGSGVLMLFPVNVKRNKDVYLPFIDKNGKTQEIMSLIILLARDNMIKDQGVLDEIRR